MSMRLTRSYLIGVEVFTSSDNPRTSSTAEMGLDPSRVLERKIIYGGDSIRARCARFDKDAPCSIHCCISKAIHRVSVLAVQSRCDAGWGFASGRRRRRLLGDSARLRYSERCGMVPRLSLWEWSW